MYFKHRYPTSEEIKTISIIDITEDMVPWRPETFEDDPHKIDVESGHTNADSSSKIWQPTQPAPLFVNNLQIVHENDKENDNDEFHDTEDPANHGCITYFDHDTNQEEIVKYYDTSDKIPDKVIYGRAIPLTLYCSSFVRILHINDYLQGLTDDELFGRDIPFDSFKHINYNNMFVFMNTTDPDDVGIQDEQYPDLATMLNDKDQEESTDSKPSSDQSSPAMATMHRLKKSQWDWDLLQEKLAFFSKDVVQETLQRTTQLARYIQTFPIRKHTKSMF